METRSGRVVSLTASTRAQNEGSHATAVEAGPLGICPPPLAVTASHSYRGNGYDG